MQGSKFRCRTLCNPWLKAFVRLGWFMRYVLRPCPLNAGTEASVCREGSDLYTRILKSDGFQFRKTFPFSGGVQKLGFALFAAAIVVVYGFLREVEPSNASSRIRGRIIRARRAAREIATACIRPDTFRAPVRGRAQLQGPPIPTHKQIDVMASNILGEGCQFNNQAVNETCRDLQISSLRSNMQGSEQLLGLTTPVGNLRRLSLG